MGAFYRISAMDFWGFGDSDKKCNSYAVQDFVRLVVQNGPARNPVCSISRVQYEWKGWVVCCHPVSATGQHNCRGRFANCQLIAGRSPEIARTKAHCDNSILYAVGIPSGYTELFPTDLLGPALFGHGR